MSAIRVEIRADAREFDRCTQERFAHAAAIRREEVCLAVGIDVAQCTEDLATVDELRCDDFALGETFPFTPEFLVDDRERIVGPNVEHEVDIPGEDASEVHDRAVRHARLCGRLEQGGPDRTVGRNAARLKRPFDDACFETGIGALDLEQVDDVELFAQRENVGAVMSDGHGIARFDQPQVPAGVLEFHDAGQVADAQAFLAE